MRRVLQKTIAALLAVLMLSSFLSVTAVELEDENGEPSAAEVGAGVPVITSMRSDREGVRIEWQTITGVHHYRVDKWYSDGRGWQRLTDTTQLYYVDPSVVSPSLNRKTTDLRSAPLREADSSMECMASKAVLREEPLAVA